MNNYHLAKCCILIVLFGISSACSKKYLKQGNDTPQCINAKINDWKKGAIGTCEKGNSVQQFTFQNKTVYVFSPGECGSDMATIVLDVNCKQLGMLGGIEGNTKINGEEFSKAIFVKNIWSN